MPGNYTPPCIYSMPEHLAHRLQIQGVSVAETILTAQVAARAGDSDQHVHDFLNTVKTKVHNAKAAGQGG